MPLIDAFNHASLPTKTEFEFSAAAFRLRSPTRVKENEEVFISYGALGNDELLVRYGFVALDESAVEHDTYVYQGLAAWLDANHEPCRRARAPMEIEQKKSETRAWRRTSARACSGATGPRTRTWSGRCGARWRRRRSGPRRAAPATGSSWGGGAPEKRAREALAAACAARLAEMETSVAEDEATLAGGRRPGPRARRRAVPPGEEADPEPGSAEVRVDHLRVVRVVLYVSY